MNGNKRLIEILKNNQGDNTYYITDEAVQKISDVLLENGVVVLPCKVGEKVFEIIKDCFSCSHYKEDGFCFCGRKPTDELFDLFEVDWDKDCVYAISETHFNYNMVKEMGETVFLTREEAEKKLKG